MDWCLGFISENCQTNYPILYGLNSLWPYSFSVWKTCLLGLNRGWTEIIHGTCSLTDAFIWSVLKFVCEAKTEIGMWFDGNHTAQRYCRSSLVTHFSVRVWENKCALQEIAVLQLPSRLPDLDHSDGKSWKWILVLTVLWGIHPFWGACIASNILRNIILCIFLSHLYS